MGKRVWKKRYGRRYQRRWAEGRAQEEAYRGEDPVGEEDVRDGDGGCDAPLLRKRRRRRSLLGCSQSCPAEIVSTHIFLRTVFICTPTAGGNGFEASISCMKLYVSRWPSRHVDERSSSCDEADSSHGRSGASGLSLAHFLCSPGKMMPATSRAPGNTNVAQIGCF